MSCMTCLVMLLGASLVAQCSACYPGYYGQADSCTYTAVMNVNKTIPCNVPMCPDTPSTVLWCLMEKPSSIFFNNNDEWEICVNEHGIVSDIGNLPSVIINGVSVDGNGSLTILGSAIDTLHKDIVNCSRINTISNETCEHSQSIDLSVLSHHIFKPELSSSLESSYTVTAGQPLLFCVFGDSDDVISGSTRWMSPTLPVSISNITGQTDSCECSKSGDTAAIDLFNSVNKIQSIINLYKTDSCLIVPDRFELYFYIPQASSDTDGDYTFTMSDRRGNMFNGVQFMVNVEYVSVIPIINSPLFSSLSITENSNAILKCNITSSVGVLPLWAGSNITQLDSSFCTNESDYISCICSNDTTIGLYSIIISQVSKYNDNNDELAQTVAALVICKATPTLQSESIICQAANVTKAISLTIITTTASLITPSQSSLLIAIPTVLVTSVPSINISSITTPNSTAFPSSSSQPSNSDGSTQLLLLAFVIVFVLLVVGIVVLVTMVMFCRCLLRGRKQQRGNNIQRSLYNWFPLVDKREFTREHLIFLEKKGEGQFGEVWKAIAPGIVPGNQTRNIVAVKRVKDSATYLDTNVLLQELQIMKMISTHPNVINLLGYCTLPKHKPLYIIMELAEHGNLKDYLVLLRRLVQPKPSTTSQSSHDHTVLSSPPHPHPSMGSPPVSPNADKDDAICMCQSNCDCQQQQQQQHSYVNLFSVLQQQQQHRITNYYNDTVLEQQNDTCDKGEPPVGVVNKLIPNDVKATPQAFCSFDSAIGSDSSNQISDSLLSNSFILDCSIQIAKGMEHLEQMKCLHRDLAARNILIAEGFLLKISDFGLARDLGDNDYYRKQTSGKLPARWMAVESLDSGRLHTHKSDVWSYGVVLWEMHTFGKRPYGSDDAANSCESLLLYLKDGNRLPRPEHCTNEMYDLMMQCWHVDPTRRSSFSDIVLNLDRLLSIEHGYLPLTERTTDTSGPIIANGHSRSPMLTVQSKSGSHSPFSILHSPMLPNLRSHSHSPFPIIHSPIPPIDHQSIDTFRSHSPFPIIHSPMLPDLRSHSHSPFPIIHSPIPPIDHQSIDTFRSHSPFPIIHSPIPPIDHRSIDTFRSHSHSPFPINHSPIISIDQSIDNIRSDSRSPFPIIHSPIPSIDHETESHSNFPFLVSHPPTGVSPTCISPISFTPPTDRPNTLSIPSSQQDDIITSSPTTAVLKKPLTRT